MQETYQSTHAITPVFLEELKIKFPFLKDWEPGTNSFLRGIRRTNPLTEPATGIAKLNSIYFCNTKTEDMKLYVSKEAEKKLRFFSDILPEENQEEYEYILVSENLTAGIGKRLVYSLCRLIPAREVKEQITKDARKKVSDLKAFFDEDV